MEINEIKDFNKVELEEAYLNNITKLKKIKNELLYIKLLSALNIGLGSYSIIDGTYNICINNYVEDHLLLVAFGIINFAILDNNIIRISELKKILNIKEEDIQKIKKEIKVRTFIKNKSKNTYQI